MRVRWDIDTKPTYDIHDTKRQVAAGDFSTIGKVRKFIRDRYPDMSVTEIIKDVFSAIQPEDFYKTLELEKFPGCMGDVYFADYDDRNWYVKFMVEEGEVRIRVLSCKWDGYSY